MLDYSTAKKLKEAGFPSRSIQDGGKWVEDTTQVDEMGMYLVAYSPELSELIEACGDSFTGLIRTTDGSWVAGRLFYDEVVDNLMPKTKGSTPIEAVANLWLALHSKS